jgi:hypothetical protein
MPAARTAAKKCRYNSSNMLANKPFRFSSCWRWPGRTGRTIIGTAELDVSEPDGDADRGTGGCSQDRFPCPAVVGALNQRPGHRAADNSRDPARQRSVPNEGPPLPHPATTFRRINGNVDWRGSRARARAHSLRILGVLAQHICTRPFPHLRKRDGSPSEQSRRATSVRPHPP